MAGNVNNSRVQSRPQVHHSRANLPRQLQQQLNQQRNAGMFCDVTLKVQGAEFPVHRCVLAAFSPHFSLLLSNSDTTVVELNSLTEVGLRAVINFMYTSNFILTQDNIVAISAAAWYLQISELTQDCQMFLLKNLQQGGGGVSSVSQGRSSTDSSVQTDDTNSLRADDTNKLQRFNANLQASQSYEEKSDLARPTENRPVLYSEEWPEEEICYHDRSNSLGSHGDGERKQEVSNQHGESVYLEQSSNVPSTEVPDVITIKDEEEDIDMFTQEEGFDSFHSSDSNSTNSPFVASPESGIPSAPLEHRVTSDGIIVSAQANEDVHLKNLLSQDAAETSSNRRARRYECGQCKFRFTMLSHLKNHVRIHTGERPFSCDMCPSRFSRKDHLTLHYRTHTGERPYKCPICPKSFAQRSTLTVHMSRKHAVHKKTSYKCSECPATFPNEMDLTNHVLCHRVTTD